MTTTSNVLADMGALRSALRRQGDPHCELFRLTPWRVVLDIAFDWISIFSAVALVVWVNELLAPLAVVLIANRQRALGNILHDAGHRNLWRDRRRNDLVARLFIAPLLFASLSLYRETHFKHHMALGEPGEDPDFLTASQKAPASWVSNYLEQVLSRSAWQRAEGLSLGGSVGVFHRVFAVGRGGGHAKRWRAGWFGQHQTGGALGAGSSRWLGGAGC
jgi:fatty acid desaturase